MITPGGTNTDEQAIRHVLENEFLTRAKSLSKYSEVYRSVHWLLTKPKRGHLVPESAFLQFDATPGRARHLTKQTAERFVDDYINEEQGQGRRLRRDIVCLRCVYYRRVFTTSGGLIFYEPDFVDQFRKAASYVDRILKGEEPAGLPLQAPNRYELAINLPAVLTRADEVIE
jgi:hypothetical protein